MAKHADTADRKLSASCAADGSADNPEPARESSDESTVLDEPQRHGLGDGADPVVPHCRSRIRSVTAAGFVIVIALGSLAGWLGYGAYQGHRSLKQQNLFVEVGRQAALNLTTINYTEVDADAQRILASATGGFYDDFSKRSQPFVDVVKHAQSKSEGTVTAAGLESQSGDRAQVFVAVTVKTTNAGSAEQEPRAWRMRISVEKVNDAAKVSNVVFVP
jgi:Mce-associated membrane protein